jgi:Skp family chaperone for outer membrane proteins
MKWSFAAMLSLALVLSASAQERKVRGVPTGTTRVAVINLGAVFTKYEKTAWYKDELARTLKGMQEEAKKLTLDIAGWQTKLQKNELKGEAKEQLEEKLLNAKRRYEDLDRLAKSRVGKTQQDSLEKMWGEIHDAVKTYAAKHKIELVIAYGDHVKKEASMTFPDIDRKMRTADQGGSMPFFVGPGVDISEAVTEMLNQNYRAEKAKAPAGRSVDL